MKTGRRIANPAAKELAGTYRKDRHADIVTLASPAKDEPVCPAYLSELGRAVWNEELRRVVSVGITEADSSMFARYCEMEASFRASIAAGQLPIASLLTELRRSAELLGIAGLRSRLARAGKSDDDKKDNPFTVRK